jgi:hypothetical protein
LWILFEYNSHEVHLVSCYDIASAAAAVVVTVVATIVVTVVVTVF